MTMAAWEAGIKSSSKEVRWLRKISAAEADVVSCSPRKECSMVLTRSSVRRSCMARADGGRMVYSSEERYSDSSKRSSRVLDLDACLSTGRTELESTR